jgi:hypothetical protein
MNSFWRRAVLKLRASVMSGNHVLVGNFGVGDYSPSTVSFVGISKHLRFWIKRTRYSRAKKLNA